METLLAVVIPAAITLAGALIGHAIKARADAVTGYAALCSSLQEELATQRQRLSDVEARLNRERETWDAERADFLCKIDEQGVKISAQDSKIAELEAINAKLQRQLNQLRAETRGRE